MSEQHRALFLFNFTIWIARPIGLGSRVFAYGPRDRGLIAGRFIPKTQKWYLMPPCLTLSNIRYGSRVKWRNPGKETALFPTSLSCSLWKASLQVALDYGCQLYIYIYIYIYIREKFRWYLVMKVRKIKIFTWYIYS